MSQTCREKRSENDEAQGLAYEGNAKALAAASQAAGDRGPRVSGELGVWEGSMESVEHCGPEQGAGGGPVACPQTWDTRLRGPRSGGRQGRVLEASLRGKGCNLGQSSTTEARGDEGTERVRLGRAVQHKVAPTHRPPRQARALWGRPAGAPDQEGGGACSAAAPADSGVGWAGHEAWHGVFTATEQR